jgi:L-lactate dehydrogenase complex protein LldG
MSKALSARDVILQRIKSANRGGIDLQTAEQAWSNLPRNYIQASTRGREDMIALFIERLEDYEAQVERIRSAAVSSVVARILSQRGDPRMLVPAGVSHELPATFTLDDNFSAAELNHFDGVLTEATLAIAETGTIVLQNVPGQGRRAATLVPDFHLCIVKTSDVVATVPEAMKRLAETASLPTTFVSGPSATADIEMTRIKGVHGPRFLSVLVVD